MDEILRKQIWRKLEALPHEQQLIVADFVDFLGSKYAIPANPQSDVFQSFAESVHKGLRRTKASATTVKGTMKVIGAADRVLDSFREAKKEFLSELEAGKPVRPPKDDGKRNPPESREIVVD